MPTSVLVVDQYSLMIPSVPQVLNNCYNASVHRSCPITACTLLMPVWAVKVWFKKVITESFRVAVQLLTSLNLLALSTVYEWPATTCWGQHWKWRPSWDLHEECVGHCVCWLVGKYWCYCRVSTAGLLHPKSVTSSYVLHSCNSYCLLYANRCCSLQ